MQEQNLEQIKELFMNQKNSENVTAQDIENAKKLLSDEQKQKLKGMLSDRNSLNELLSSPAAIKILNLLNNKD